MHPFPLLLGKGHAVVAEQIFLNQAVLDYIQSRPEGLAKAGFILRHFADSFHTNDPVLNKIIDLASINKDDYI